MHVGASCGGPLLLWANKHPTPLDIQFPISSPGDSCSCAVGAIACRGLGAVGGWGGRSMAGSSGCFGLMLVNPLIVH